MVGSQLTSENQAQKSVKQILIALTAAFNKLNLYSENHRIYQDALNLLQKILDTFLKQYGSFRIDIERGRILYGGRAVYEGKLESSDPAFILYRDGVLSIRFQEGIDLWELDTFLNILHRHVRQEENLEDDIVTELWEYNMPSIGYEAVELDLGAEDVFKLADLHGCVESADETGQDEEEPDCQSSEIEQPTPSADMCLLLEPDSIWHLTPAEREELRKMIAEEEKLDGKNYTIEVLLYILEQQVQPRQDISELLDCLFQELREAMLDERYAYVRIVLQRLKKYMQALHLKNHESAPVIEKFYRSLSSEKFLNVLTKVSLHIKNCEPDEIKEFKQALLLLDASAIPALGSLLMTVQSAVMNRLLLETIGSMASRDFRPLETLLKSCQPELLLRLLPILGFLKDPRSRQTLTSLLRSDTVAVRKAALKAVLRRDVELAQDALQLIDDPDDGIRAMVLAHLGQRRSEEAEDVMLEFLETHKFQLLEGSELFAAYLTLGKCGSDRSIPFLKKQLFVLPGIGVLRSAKSPRRQAALIALRELRTASSAELVEKSKCGFFTSLFRGA